MLLRLFIICMIATCCASDLESLRIRRPDGREMSVPFPHFINRQELENSPVFDTDQLGDPKEVIKYLSKHGFEEVTFETLDGKTLKGLQRIIPNAEFSFIGAGGFFPGRHTGISTWFEMLPRNCNMLLFLERYKAEGLVSFARYLPRYATKSHLDTLAAIKHLNALDEGKPIILYGSCAGAFHHLRFATLTQQAADNGNEEARRVISLVRLIIGDSTWQSVAVTAPTAVPSQIKKCSSIPTVPRWALYWAAKALLPSFLELYRRNGSEAATTLVGQMKYMPCPVLFLHSKDDTFAPWEHTEAMIKELTDAHTADPEVRKRAAIFLYLLEKSSHTMHYFKWRDPCIIAVNAAIDLAIKDPAALENCSEGVNLYQIIHPKDLQQRAKPKKLQAAMHPGEGLLRELLELLQC